MVLGQGDRAESTGIRLEREVGHAVDERKFIPFVLDAGAEMHAELHGRASVLLLRRIEASRECHYR